MKLKAATLIESLIAMVILVTCFGIGTMIWSNVMDSDDQRRKLKGILILEEIAEETKRNKEFIETENEYGEYLVSSFFEKQTEARNLYRFSLILTDKEGKRIAERNELIITE